MALQLLNAAPLHYKARRKISPLRLRSVSRSFPQSWKMRERGRSVKSGVMPQGQSANLPAPCRLMSESAGPRGQQVKKCSKKDQSGRPASCRDRSHGQGECTGRFACYSLEGYRTRDVAGIAVRAVQTLPARVYPLRLPPGDRNAFCALSSLLPGTLPNRHNGKMARWSSIALVQISCFTNLAAEESDCLRPCLLFEAIGRPAAKLLNFGFLELDMLSRHRIIFFER